jgi:hypothetical protein
MNITGHKRKIITIRRALKNKKSDTLEMRLRSHQRAIKIIKQNRKKK